MKNWFLDFARGASLGTGILPGVSVGTVGLIVKIYDKLIGAIDDLRHHFGKAFLTLLPIALGCMASAVLLLLFWQKAASVYFPFPLIAALAGFVAGGIPLIISNIHRQEKMGMDILRVALGFFLAGCIGVLSYLSAAGVLPSLSFQEAFDHPYQNAWIFVVVLLVGFIAAVACLIPGISGSMVLFIFGLYQPVVNLYISAGDGSHVSMFHNQEMLVPGLLLTLILLIGVIAGLLATSKAMKGLLEKHPQGTYTWVLGFILGSVVSMFFNNQMYTVYTTPNTSTWYQYLIGALTFTIVFGLMLFYFRKSKKPESNGVVEN